MTRAPSILVALLLLLAVIVARPACAELKLASRTSAKTAAASAAAESNPMFAAFGEMMLQMIVPNGPVEMTAIIGENRARMEYTYKLVPGGGQ